MERNDFENLKFFELIAATERVIEENFKSISKLLAFIFVLELVTSFATYYLDVESVLYNVVFIFYIFTMFFANIVFIKSLKTKCELIESRKNLGSSAEGLFRYVGASMIYGLLIFVISLAIALVGGVLYLISQDLLNLAILVAGIPISAVLLYSSIVFQGIYYEIFIKNTHLVESVKSAINNINRSENKTLLKILGSSILGAIIYIALGYSILSENSGIVVIVIADLLSAVLGLFVLTFNYLAYMSSKVKENKAVEADSKNISLQ